MDGCAKRYAVIRQLAQRNGAVAADPDRRRISGRCAVHFKDPFCTAPHKPSRFDGHKPYRVGIYSLLRMALDFALFPLHFRGLTGAACGRLEHRAPTGYQRVARSAPVIDYLDQTETA